MSEKKQKIRVGLVFGGRSGEHEVSLASATSVMTNLDKEKYGVVPIGITKEGSWWLGLGPADIHRAGDTPSSQAAFVGTPAGTATGLSCLRVLIPAVGDGERVSDCLC